MSSKDNSETRALVSAAANYFARRSLNLYCAYDHTPTVGPPVWRMELALVSADLDLLDVSEDDANVLACDTYATFPAAMAAAFAAAHRCLQQ